MYRENPELPSTPNPKRILLTDWRARLRVAERIGFSESDLKDAYDWRNCAWGEFTARCGSAYYDLTLRQRVRLSAKGYRFQHAVESQDLPTALRIIEDYEAVLNGDPWTKRTGRALRRFLRISA